MSELEIPNKLRRDLELAKDLQEVKSITDLVSAYIKACQKTRQPIPKINEYSEIYIKGSRKAGQINIIMDKNRGASKKGWKTRSHDVTTYEELGIQKMEAARWRKLAIIPDEIFNEYITSILNKNREILTINGLLHYSMEVNKIPFPELPQEKYKVIYADPPWKYGQLAFPLMPGQEGHYPLLTPEEIASLPIKDITADNAVLFLWVTWPILCSQECFPVIKEWGFDCKASFVWDKVKHNMGHYNSVRSEVLFISIKNSCPLEVKKLYDQVQVIERSDEHSEKPEEFRDIIDTIYPFGKRIEIFARKEVEGWDSYGAE